MRPAFVALVARRTYPKTLWLISPANHAARGVLTNASRQGPPVQLQERTESAPATASPRPRAEVVTTSLSPLTRSLIASSLANSVSDHSNSSLSSSVADSDASSIISGPSTAFTSFTSALSSPPSLSPGKEFHEDVSTSEFDADDDRSTTPSTTPVRRRASKTRPSLIPTFRGTPDSPRHTN